MCRPKMIFLHNRIELPDSKCARVGDESTADAERVYLEAQKELKPRIRKAKAKAELVKTVDYDPWGKPYKVVMKKLRRPPATTTMEPQTVRNIAVILFPQEDGDVLPANLAGGRTEDVLEISGGDRAGWPFREPLQGAGPGWYSCSIGYLSVKVKTLKLKSTRLLEIIIRNLKIIK